MSERLKQSPSTIYYELYRYQPYQAELAQANTKSKQSQCCRKTKLNAKLKQTILNPLYLSLSPEVIDHELKLATKFIYNWLYHEKFEFSLNELPGHGLRQRSKYNRPLGRPIEQPPIVINQRKRHR